MLIHLSIHTVLKDIKLFLILSGKPLPEHVYAVPYLPVIVTAAYWPHLRVPVGPAL